MENEKKQKFVAPKSKYWADKKKMLGLDLGIASIGWCLFEEDDGGNLKRIIDIGSYVFNQIENPKNGQTENIARRIKRSMRRQRRRRVLRLEECRSLFKKEWGMDFLNVVAKNKSNLTPFDLKVKGLHEPLTKEELAIALYHYLKYRGFKSNRKNEKTQDDSDKKMLGGIAKMKAALSASESANYVTELLKERFDNATDKSKKRYHNTSNDYFLTVDHATYRYEINALLDKQISFGVASPSFKERFLYLFDKRRDFSEGPGEGSPYKVDYKKVAGICAFDGGIRACKDAYDAQRFVLLSALNNLRFKTDYDSEYRGLDSASIKKAADVFVWKTDVKYSSLFKELKIDGVKRVKGLQITRKKYKDLLQKFAKLKNYDDSYNIPESENENLSEFILKETLDQRFFKGSQLLSYLAKSLKLAGYDKKEWPSTANEIADILFANKTDEHIEKACRDKKFDNKLTSIVLEGTGADQTIDLSLSLCKLLNERMEKGERYDEAMAALGYSHSQMKKPGQIGLMPSIEEAVEQIGEYLTNPVVKHTLVQMRRLINAIVREYGAPTHYNVELARELKKNFEERKQIRFDQQDNQSANADLKNEMLEKYPDVFRTFRDISAKGGQGDNLLKYKLFKEQGGISPYTGAMIDERHLFDKDYYQIDHIAPYSISFDDSFNNKVVVETKENQDKRNRLPLEYFSSIGRDRVVLDSFLRTHRVSPSKRENLLRKEYSDDFLNKDAGDNSYIASLAKKLIENFMLPEGVRCGSTSGAMTDKLRRWWGLSGRTHSYESSYERDYRARLLGGFKFASFDLVRDQNNDAHILGVKFSFNSEESAESFEVLFETKPKGKKIPDPEDDKKKIILFTEKQKEKNAALQSVVDHYQDFQEKFALCVGQDITALQSVLSGRRVDSSTNVDDKFVSGLLVLGYVYAQMQETLNEKNRSNHLHHALDAAVIGATTPALIQAITKFYQDKENSQYDPLTGEIKTMPFPYEDFRKEVLVRVYERDWDKMLSILNGLGNYQECPATRENTHVLIPVRLPDKDVAGAISNETIYGVDKNSGALTSRISIDKLNDKNVEKIVDKKSGNKAVYDACKVWLKNRSSSKFPILQPKGSVIRSVKIVIADSVEGKVNLSKGRFANNSDNIRVDIYKKNGDDKTLYFVPVYYYQLSREKIRERQLKNHVNPSKVVSEPKVTLTWGQGEQGSIIIGLEELTSSYKKIGSLPRYSFVEVIKKDSNFGFAYTGGATAGFFEIYSPLGDNLDLINSGLFASSSAQMRLTCSTISSIKIRSITILGRVN